MLNLKDIKFLINAGVTGLDKVEALRKSVQGLDTVGGKAARGITQSFMGLKSALAAALTTGALVLFSKSVINLGADLNDLRQKTGVAVETLARFKPAAETGGTSLEGLAVALKKLGQNVVEAGKGGKDQINAFKALGVTFQDATGKIRPTDQLLLDLSDKFSQLPDGAQKSALAVSLFGKSGADLIPFLNKGRDELEKFSLAISQGFADKSSAFNDSIAITKNRFIELGAAGVEPLLPQLTEATEAIGDMASQALGAIGELGGGMGGGMGDIANSSGQAAGAVLDLGKTFFDAIEGTELLRLAMGALEGTVKGVASVIVLVTGVTEKFINAAAGIKNLVKGGILTVAEAAGMTDGIDVGSVISNDYKVIDAKSAQISKETAARYDRIWNGAPASEAASTKKGVRDVSGADFFKDTATGEKNSKVIDEFIVKQKASIQAIADEMSMVGKSRYEIERLKAARDMDNEAAEKAVKLSEGARAGFLQTADALKQQKLAMMDLANEQERAFGTGARQAFAEYVDNAGNAARQAKDLVSNAFRGMEDVLVEFTKTGKLNFGDFTTSILADIARIRIQASITGPLADWLGGMFSPSGAQAAAGTAALRGAANPALYGPGFATGGVMTEYGVLPLKKYAEGGVARKPQISIWAEGQIPEAMVPLQDGRSIPVTLKGGGGGTNVTVNVNMADGTVAAQGNGQDIGVRIAAAVKVVLQNEMRQGGLLAARG